MECQKVNNKEAAKLLGMSVARMHALMDRKLIDIGSYQVYRSKLNKWLGLEDDKKMQTT